MDINKNILSIDKEQLLDYLATNFLVAMPEEIIDYRAMQEAGRLLIKLSSFYSYMCGLYAYARIRTRDAKRTLSKEEYEDLVDKKEIISSFCDAIKQQYNAISRAVTIKIKNDEELKMLGEI